MLNRDELEKEIIRNDYIYCDTCIALSKGFELFVNKMGFLFKKHKKKIIIISDVYQELLNKAFIGDDEQKAMAYKAIEIINNNAEIFEIETDESINKSAFADPKLLARLIENKAQSTQMLITRDHGLSVDAKKFNNLNSINGKQIKVCYVNENGYMNEFNKYEESNDIQNVKYVEVEKIVEKPVIKVVTEKPSVIDSYVKPMFVAGITYLILDKKEVIIGFINKSYKELRKAIA